MKYGRCSRDAYSRIRKPNHKLVLVGARRLAIALANTRILSPAASPAHVIIGLCARSRSKTAAALFAAAVLQCF